MTRDSKKIYSFNTFSVLLYDNRMSLTQDRKKLLPATLGVLVKLATFNTLRLKLLFCFHVSETARFIKVNLFLS